MIKRYKQVDASFFEKLRETFSYNPVEGKLRWKRIPCNRVQTGAIAGRTHDNGHIEVRFNNKSFMAHHLVWAMCHGKLPDNAILHANGNKQDNRIGNLILV